VKRTGEGRGGGGEQGKEIRTATASGRVNYAKGLLNESRRQVARDNWHGFSVCRVRLQTSILGFQARGRFRSTDFGCC
jgi:hypothetical protein